MEQILTHELIHMYDYCTAKIDFDNVHHLACTEVRAANLAHCRLGLDELRSWSKRRDCVKDKAARSVSLIKKMPKVEAEKAVEKVLDKCMKDLEPFGRVEMTETCAKLALEQLMTFRKFADANKRS